MKNCKSCSIYIEDRYGVMSIEGLIKRIKEELHSKVCEKITKKSTFGSENIISNLEKLIKIGKNRNECVIIIFDNDRGKHISKTIKKDKKTFIEKEIKDMKEKGIDTNKVYPIAFENKIEKDWVEKGTKKSLPENYEKYSLPGYTSKIDLNFLKNNDENFKNFVEAIDP